MALLCFGKSACFKDDILHVQPAGRDLAKLKDLAKLRIVFRETNQDMEVNQEDEKEFWHALDETPTDRKLTLVRFGRCACFKEDILYVTPEKGDKLFIRLRNTPTQNSIIVNEDDQQEFLANLQKQ
jgi:hypothetical protein